MNGAALMGAVSGGSSSNYGGTASLGTGSRSSINSALAKQVQNNSVDVDGTVTVEDLVESDADSAPE
jgi:hypothetical protein